MARCRVPTWVKHLMQEAVAEAGEGPRARKVVLLRVLVSHSLHHNLEQPKQNASSDCRVFQILYSRVFGVTSLLRTGERLRRRYICEKCPFLFGVECRVDGFDPPCSSLSGSPLRYHMH